MNQHVVVGNLEEVQVYSGDYRLFITSKGVGSEYRDDRDVIMLLDRWNFEDTFGVKRRYDLAMKLKIPTFTT